MATVSFSLRFVKFAFTEISSLLLSSLVIFFYRVRPKSVVLLIAVMPTNIIGSLMCGISFAIW